MSQPNDRGTPESQEERELLMPQDRQVGGASETKEETLVPSGLCPPARLRLQPEAGQSPEKGNPMPEDLGPLSQEETRLRGNTLGLSRHVHAGRAEARATGRSHREVTLGTS